MHSEREFMHAGHASCLHSCARSAGVGWGWMEGKKGGERGGRGGGAEKGREGGEDVGRVDGE